VKEKIYFEFTTTILNRIRYYIKLDYCVYAIIGIMFIFPLCFILDIILYLLALIFERKF